MIFAWPKTSSETLDVLHSQLGVALTQQLESPQCAKVKTTNLLQATLPFLPLFQAPPQDQ